MYRKLIAMVKLSVQKRCRHFFHCSAIHRNSHIPRSRPVEAEEASIVLSTVQTQFSHHAIEYAYQLNMVKAGKGHQILDNVREGVRW